MSKLRVLSLFAGIGGFDLGLERTGGFETVAFCEIESFPRKVLAKHWPNVPCYEDVRTLTADRLRADGIAVDVICGGFPCQDVSRAGSGLGLEGERSGLWFEYLRLVRELRPRFIIVENVAALLDDGLGIVLGGLASIGFDAEWSVLPMCAVGAPHMRRRVFIVAYPHGEHGWPRLWDTAAQSQWAVQESDRLPGARAGWRARMENPSELYGGANGVPDGMDRNHAIGNAVSPDAVELIGNAILASLQHHLEAA